MKYALQTRLCFIAAVLAGLIASGCETSFSPFDENDAYFSLFGYLSTAADTQYIRISPIRESIFTSSDPLDATVTLQPSAGAPVVLQEEVRQLTNGAFAHIYSTTAPVRLGEMYMLTATRSDGGTSAATVAMPDSFPDPILETGILLDSIPPYQQRIVISEIDQLIEMDIAYTVQRDSLAPVETVTVAYLAEASETADGFALIFDAYRDIRRTLNTNICPTVLDVQVSFTVADENWPDLLGVDDETLALPNTLDNVENGLGFVGGVVPKTYAWPEVVSVMEENRKACALD